MGFKNIVLLIVMSVGPHFPAMVIPTFLLFLAMQCTHTYEYCGWRKKEKGEQKSASSALHYYTYAVGRGEFAARKSLNSFGWLSILPHQLHTSFVPSHREAVRGRKQGETKQLKMPSSHEWSGEIGESGPDRVSTPQPRLVLAGYWSGWMPSSLLRVWECVCRRKAKQFNAASHQDSAALSIKLCTVGVGVERMSDIWIGVRVVLLETEVRESEYLSGKRCK